MAILLPPYSEFLQDQTAVDTLCHLYDTSPSELVELFEWWQCHLTKAGSTFEDVVTQDILCHLSIDIEAQMRDQGLEEHQILSTARHVRLHMERITVRLKQASKRSRLLYHLPHRLQEEPEEWAPPVRSPKPSPSPSQLRLVSVM